MGGDKRGEGEGAPVRQRGASLEGIGGKGGADHTDGKGRH